MEKMNTIQEFVERFNKEERLSLLINDISIVCNYVLVDNDGLSMYGGTNKQYVGSIDLRDIRYMCGCNYKWVAD